MATKRVNADGSPKPFQVSERAAARHVVRALRREPANLCFPWTISVVVKLLRRLPPSASGPLLRRLAK